MAGYKVKEIGALGSIDYTKVYTSILESLGVIRRIIWNDHKVINDVSCIYPLDDDNVFITDYYFYYVALLNLRTGFKWKIDIRSGYMLRNAMGIDYDPDTHRLFVGCRDGVLVLDSRTGGTIKRITKLGDYDLKDGYQFNVRLDRSDGETIYFVSEKKHILVKYNLTNDTYSIFGTYSTPKSDLTGLDSPMDVDVGEDYDEVYVADRANDRILVLDKDLNVQRLMYLHNVGFIYRQRWGSKYTNLYGIASSPRIGVMTYIMLTELYNISRIVAFIPQQGDYPRFTPDLNYMWVGQAYGIEINLLAAKNVLASRGLPALQQSMLILNRASVTTDGVTTRVITPLWFRDVMLEVISDQDGTAYIEVPEGSWAGIGLWYLTDHTWVEYDSFSFSANKSTPYIFSQPPPVFRLKLKPSANATISVRITLR